MPRSQHNMEEYLEPMSKETDNISVFSGRELDDLKSRASRTRPRIPQKKKKTKKAAATK